MRLFGILSLQSFPEKNKYKSLTKYFEVLISTISTRLMLTTK